MSKRTYGQRGNSKRRKRTRALLNVCQHTCVLCGRKMSPTNRTLEHIVPVSEGGRFDFDNIVLSHEVCNKRRGSKPLNNVQMFRARIVLMRMRYYLRNVKLGLTPKVH